MNILLVTTDQQRADHLGFAGDPTVRTPNLDALASASRVFRRAHVANPTCMPNRASIVTGRLPSSHGTRVNGLALDRDAETFARALRRDGYRTALIGKSHLQPLGHGEDEVNRLLAGGPRRDAVDRDWPEGWDTFEHIDRHRRGWVEMPADYYGFDHVLLTGGISAAAGGHYHHWLLEQGFDPATHLGVANARRRSALWDQVFQPDVPEELYTTSYITDRSLDFLDTAARLEQPFLLWCSFPDPHHPFAPPGDYFDRYDPSAVTLPPTFDDTHERSMPHLRAMIERRGEPAGPFSAWAPTEAQLREALAAQYGSIEMIDDAVGRLLGRLTALGLDGDTIVVFTSDHGDLFGDHGLLLKHAVHYDACTRVPLTIRVPGIAPGVTDALVSSLDLSHTLLDLCDVPIHGGAQGHSLVPCLSDPKARVRDALLIEEDELFGVTGLPGPVRMRTLLTDSARLTVYAGTEEAELFDHTTDPEERRNRHADPDAGSLREAMRARLIELLLRAADESRTPRYTA